MRTVVPSPAPVLVFKTSVETICQVNSLKPLLDALLKENERWIFDLEDCDRILRVESLRLSPGRIIETVQGTGFYCEELEV